MTNLYRWNYGETPTRIDLPSTIAAISVHSSSSSNAILTSDGNVLTWGTNKCGQLGHGDCEPQAFPKIIEFFLDKKIVYLSMSGSCTAVLTDTGEVYYWGWVEGKLALNPILCELKEVSKVELGDFHMLALVRKPSKGNEMTKSDPHESYLIYAWGKNNRGQLGLGVEARSVQEPKLLHTLADLDVIDVACGEEVSGCVTSTGKLYVWGCGIDGISGKGVEEIIYEPSKVPINHRIVSIKMGRGFVMALTAKGRLYAWGRNEFGQLGRAPSNTVEIVPKSVKGVKGHKFVGFSCGKDFTIAWTGGGKLFSWGYHAIGSTESVCTPTDVSSSFLNHKYVDFSCYTSCYVVSNDFNNEHCIYEYVQEPDITYIRIFAAISSKLIELILAQDYPREAYLEEVLDTFLLTFRSRLSQHELLSQLISHFQVPPGAQFLPPIKRREYLNTFRSRICQLLIHWIEDHWQLDFEPNQQLKTQLERTVLFHCIFPLVLTKASDFLNNSSHFHWDMRELAGVWQNRGRTLKLRRFKEVERKTNLQPRMEGPGQSYESFSIHTIPLDEFAKQLSILDFELFKAIKMSEFEKLGWSKSNKHETSPNVLATITQFNRFSNWVVFIIVSCLQFEQRVNLLKRFISLTQELLRLNNFSSAISILSALNNAAVVRLKQTWKAVGEEFNERVAILEKFISADRSYSVLRCQLDTCGLPCVPYLGMFLRDLTFIEDGNLDVIETKINVKKMILLGNTYRQILNNEKYQVIGYEAKYKLIKPIQTWIKSFKSPNADSMFEMSLQIEPREGSEWNAIKSLLNEKHNHLREIARLKRLLEKNNIPVDPPPKVEAPGTPRPQGNPQQKRERSKSSMGNANTPNSNNKSAPVTSPPQQSRAVLWSSQPRLPATMARSDSEPVVYIGVKR